MFGWFRSAPSPETSPENPGKGTSLKFAFANSERAWSEEADLVRILAKVMGDAGHTVRLRKGWLEVDEAFVILPRFVSMQPLEPSGVSTCSTIEVRHSKHIPKGVFEYQHSRGEDLASSFAKGFETWLEVDFSVLQDVVLERPDKCLALEMTIPSKNGGPSHFRRALLGPVSLSQAEPPVDSSSEDEHPPFCGCCLFTSMSDHLKERLEDGHFYALRFFAMRNEDGSAQADCRINGIDWEPGKQALVEYVSRWPGQGFQFRKQYGVIQSVEGPFDAPEDERS